MALETATYVDQLVPTNPTHTDPFNQFDSHLRLIKQVLLNQFPNLGSAAVSATAASLNAAAALQPAGPGAVAAPWYAAGSTSVSQVLCEAPAGTPLVAVGNNGAAGFMGSTDPTQTTWSTAATWAGGNLTCNNNLGVDGSLQVVNGGTLSGTVDVLGPFTAASGALLVGGTTVSGVAVLSGGATVEYGGVVVANGGSIVLSGGGSLISTSGGVYAGGVVSAAGAFQGGTGQLVPSGSVVLYPATSGLPNGYGLANTYVNTAPPSGYNWIYKT